MSKRKWYQKPIYLLVALALALSLGIAALPMSGTIKAATAIYVNDATGSDAWDGEAPEWDGTSGPKRTIQEGITVVDPGGTVHVAAGALPPSAPTSPLCEGVTNPTGVTDPTPEFSWNFSDPDVGDTQGAYRILVASTVAILNTNTGDMWDSGKVNSSASEVSYAGTALADNETYHWKVMTWDNNGTDGPYCPPQEFTTGSFPSEVWVDDDYCDSCPNDGHTWGYDAFDKIQDGIDAVASSTVHVAAGTYGETIILKDGLQVLGAGADVTTIDGGGTGPVVYAYNVSSDTELDGFTVTNGTAFFGAGIYVSSATPIISNCIFSGNSATMHAGGMYSYNSSPTVTNCTFRGNTAGTVGGGMYNGESSPNVTNCIFQGNSADDEGGGMYNYQSSPAVTNCIFRGNTASFAGGGMYNRDSSSPSVTNCIFRGNSAEDDGGGMYNTDSSPSVTNCIFHGNSAQYGGGMYNTDSSPSVTNCILWDNGEELYNVASSAPVVTYCDIKGGYSGVGNIDADPMFVNPSAHDFHSKPDSPCIDAGTNDGAPAEDIEGNARPADGDGDGTATTDMGAYEYVSPAPPPPPVGGEAYPVNKIPLLAPWVAAAALLAGGAGWYVLRRRRARS